MPALTGKKTLSKWECTLFAAVPKIELCFSRIRQHVEGRRFAPRVQRLHCRTYQSQSGGWNSAPPICLFNLLGVVPGNRWVVVKLSRRTVAGGWLAKELQMRTILNWHERQVTLGKPSVNC